VRDEGPVPPNVLLRVRACVCLLREELQNELSSLERKYARALERIKVRPAPHNAQEARW
jgi:hypothetical protein